MGLERDEEKQRVYLWSHLQRWSRIRKRLRMRGYLLLRELGLWVEGLWRDEMEDYVHLVPW